MNFLFDVDGTLTPPMGKMNNRFRIFFGEWVLRQQQNGNKVFLVTGSDRKKTIGQVGIALYRLVNGSYQSCGNELYIRNRLIKRFKWAMSASLHLDILDLLSESIWYGRADNNIEERAGMINISAVGRSANKSLRKKYSKWDKENRERRSIVDTLSSKYPDLEFSIGGEISIDIYPKGKDKCDVGGNDFTIATMSKYSYNVKGWKQTKKILAKRHKTVDVYYQNQ